MSSLGWTCSSCTYVHKFPSSRCSMCNELRVNRHQMRDFILGKPIENKPGPLHTKKNPMLHEEEEKKKENVAVHEEHDEVVIVNSLAAASTTTDGPAPSTVHKFFNPYTQNSNKYQVETAAKAVVMPPQGESSNDKPSSLPQQNQTLSNPYLRKANTLRPSSGGSSTTNISSNSNNGILQNVQKVPREAASSSSTVRNINTSLRRQALQPLTKKTTSQYQTKKPSVPANYTAPLTFETGPVPFDPETCKEWIFPVSDVYSKRQYQIEMASTAVHHNTLVSLPTGLGKTLIAAVVMYNYYRWFPTGKVIFLAPTQPLVKQQVGACHDIMGFAPTDTALLTGNTNAERRAEIWAARRVFYCTPQTVQRDLEANRLDPSQVVCCVLDEAHKATGDYAYVKIIEHLTKAGAKFRVLALSATPGTSIKGIQLVVDALRINRIEARTEDDPSVAPYIHRRDTEYIIVPRTSASKKVERALTDIISPILSTLRSSGALRHPGYATMTSYALLKAAQTYRENGGSGAMYAYFMAGRQFVQLRDDLHTQGVSFVRRHLQRLRDERNTGLMSTIVNGKEFEKLWETVLETSSSQSAAVEEKLANNPKLAKLQEILSVHFEQHRACATSSRAIVFSQWRDSVSEIVAVLDSYKPLIRPRCFVGQNSGTGKGKLKGMKQAEQQEVIRQFRQDVYNVLVCTSIGEEGLDIGQVDLIVNFDTLKSPIRTIQRIGRTGRKRDGRVVCLIAEGSEENTLKAAKQSERTLAHALSNPRAFKVVRTAPLLPEVPQLSEQTMTIGSSFRMSQVDGANVASRKPPAAANKTATSRGKVELSWQLSPSEDNHRSRVLGSYASQSLVRDYPPGGVELLMRRFRQGRNISMSGRSSDVSRGRASGLLRYIENRHFKDSNKSCTKSTMLARSRRRDHGIVGLFPLAPCDEDENAAVFAESVNNTHLSKDDSLDVPRLAPQEKKIDSNSTCCEDPRDVELAVPADDSRQLADERREVKGVADEMKTKHAARETYCQVADGCPPNDVPVHSSSVGADIPTATEMIVDEFVLASQDDSDSDTDSEEGREVPVQPESHHRNDGTDSNNNLVGAVFSTAPALEPVHNASLAPPDLNAGEIKLPENATDDFLLPSQGSASGDEEEASTEETERHMLPAPEKTHGAVFESENSSKTGFEDFVLPSQDESSSDENDSENEDQDEVVRRIRQLGEVSGERRSTFGSSELCDTQPSSPPAKGSPKGGMLSPRRGVQRRNPKLDDHPQSVQASHHIESLSSSDEIVCRGRRQHQSLNRQSLTSSDGFELCDTQPCPPSNASTRSQPLESLTPNREVPLVKRRRLELQQFFEEEAGIDSDDDRDGDESETDILQIEEEEEEENISGFINDSSQLGYSPDALDEVDADTTHRAVDAHRARAQQFATPILNRRMRNVRSSAHRSGSAPDSACGLGNMNFIRSVIEHHKNGGEAEDIERFYHELEVAGDSQQLE